MIAALVCTRVKGLNGADCGKLFRLMKYNFNRTKSKKLRLILSAGKLPCIKWYVDATSGPRPNLSLLADSPPTQNEPC